MAGLSPRVRGIHPVPDWWQAQRRSIPACTGNPSCSSARRCCTRVYPRVYGESRLWHGTQSGARGLSPRVRGIRAEPCAYSTDDGSIPACTGNPRASRRCSGPRRVYPRVYGESDAGKPKSVLEQGLSPRVRGIRRYIPEPGAGPGSIPACTGNPAASPACRSRKAVYPRVYGESEISAVYDWHYTGLSPRVRGIQPVLEEDHTGGGSIPACTGNPLRDASADEVFAVYPRVYGESFDAQSVQVSARGLSPRVRGIRLHWGCYLLRRGSIPACTGNPSCQGQCRRYCWVYPRVYGESAGVSGDVFAETGLSPRVRGIPSTRRHNGKDCRSIPACTGNPPRRGARAGSLRVYPRVYGESAHVRMRRTSQTGLSPRVRGIRAEMERSASDGRSIPACTGNPIELLCSVPVTQVYPRVYGESEPTALSSTAW